MATDTQVTTLADLRRDVLDRVREPSNTANQDRADRLINMALHDMHSSPGHNFPWLIRRASILTHAPYTTGTVTITAAARTTVTGSSTLWNTAVTGMGFNNARVGGKMLFEGSNEIYEASAVGSDTAITLTDRWTGDALSGATYVYFEDEYSLASDFTRLVDIRNFSLEVNIPIIGPQEFRRLYVRNQYRRKPKVATIIQLAFSTSTAPRYRVLFHPAPDDEYQIPYNFITSNLAVTSAGAEQTQLSGDTDEPIVPLKFRHGLVFFAVAEWLGNRKDDPRGRQAKNDYIDLVRRMLSEVPTGYDRPRFVLRKYGWGSRRGRFDVNDRFDSMD